MFRMELVLQHVIFLNKFLITTSVTKDMFSCAKENAKKVTKLALRFHQTDEHRPRCGSLYLPFCR